MMKLDLVVDDHDPFPEARRLLSALDDRKLYSEQHGLRHPLAIYNLSFKKVMQRLTNVLLELERIEREGKYVDPSDNKWADRIVLEQDHLLDALIEHYEDCRGLLHCFFESTSDPLLVKADSAFKKTTKNYRDHVAKIVNAIKHNHRDIAWIVFYGQGFHSGYFLVAPDKKGVIGPDPMIHDGGKTAFSFARDLRLHTCGLYLLGEALGGALRAIGLRRHGSEPATVTDLARATSDALRRVSLLPLTYFSDEASKPFPVVKGVGRLDHPQYRIAFPAAQRVRVASGPLRVSFGEGDGVSRTYRPPYWKPS